MRVEGKNNQQPCERVIDRVAEQRAWVDVIGKDHKINKMGIKQGHLPHLQNIKEMPKRHHYGEIPQSYLWTKHAGLPPLSACTWTHTVWGANKMSEMCVCLQGYDLIGIMETCRGGSQDWIIGMEGYRLFRKYRKGRKEWDVVLYVNDHLEWMELCLGMDEELTENLWVGTKGKMGLDDIIVGLEHF